MKSVYFDTSDLSYLLLGRAPAHVGDIAAHRARLERLVRSDRAQMIVSFVHLAEMALKPDVAAAGLSWLEAELPIFIVTTGAEDLFRAELRGETIPIVVARLTPQMLHDARLPLRLGPLSMTFTGTQAAKGLKRVMEAWSLAESWGKRARQRRPGMRARRHREMESAARRTTMNLIDGDTSSLPSFAARVAPVFRSAASAALRSRGLTLSDVHRNLRQAPGRSWMTGLVEPSQWKAAEARLRDPSQAPGSALRDAIETWEAGDAHRAPRSSTQYDVRHVAYAARCELATLDGPNYRATAKVRPKLVRTQFFETAQIGAVLDAIETAPE